MMFAVIAFDVSPTLAVAVGAAAGMAAATRLLFASLLFALLIVGGHGLEAIPAAVLAAAAAWVTVAALERRAEASAADPSPRPRTCFDRPMRTNTGPPGGGCGQGCSAREPGRAARPPHRPRRLAPGHRLRRGRRAARRSPT